MLVKDLVSPGQRTGWKISNDCPRSYLEFQRSKVLFQSSANTFPFVTFRVICVQT